MSYHILAQSALHPIGLTLGFDADTSDGIWTAQGHTVGILL